MVLKFLHAHPILDDYNSEICREKTHELIEIAGDEKLRGLLAGLKIFASLLFEIQFQVKI